MFHAQKHVTNVTFYHLSNRYLSNVTKISAKMSSIYTDKCLETLFTFQQNNALAHCAHETIAVWDTRFHSARADLWPPNSPDLNQVDYMVWRVTGQHVYQSKHSWQTEGTLNCCMVRFQWDIIDIEIDHWRKYFQACVWPNDGHFEHLLWFFFMCFWFKWLPSIVSDFYICQVNGVNWRDIMWCFFPSILPSVCAHSVFRCKYLKNGLS